MNSFGWRFMPLVFGSLLVMMTIRMARRLSRSTLIGAIAGIFLTFDGLSFAMSRIALLDIFQAFFLVAAVACVVADRDFYRGWLADRLEAIGVPDLGGRFGPVLWWRPWRLLAGVMFGLAIGTKWNSVYVLATMGILSVVWDVGARRLAGADFKAWLALVIDGIPALIRLVVVSAVVYVATWWGWLTTTGGWDRDWGDKHPDDPLTRALGPMWSSFIQYQKDIYNFHTGDYIAKVTHTYAAAPAGWLFAVRPIGIDAVNGIKPGEDGCPTDVDGCLRVVSGIGTPVLWWMAAIALVVGLVWWIGGRDWRFGVPIIAAMSTYIPWFFAGTRPLFYFYAITIIPFTATVLAMVLGLILGPADGPKRFRGGVIVGALVALVVLNFAYIYPVLTDGLLTRDEYYSRMWLQSWI
jgi:dolichyl-phosphate-mannose--protein O-mannosyl transferase